MSKPTLDQVGPWSEIKLEILRRYAEEYTKILRKQEHVIREAGYIDGFAGWGTHISRESGEEIEGSPAIALRYPFSSYHFIDMDGKRAARLRELSAGRDNVHVHEGDANVLLVRDVYPQYRYEDYRRALCVLDPYELNPTWDVVQTAGKMKSVEVFINFMIMDANRNILRSDASTVTPEQAQRMSAFWGDDSWRDVAYRSQPGLFGEMTEKAPNKVVVAAYRRRLREVAGFAHVPEPLCVPNTKGVAIYYLFFASPKATGAKIARHIFDKYRRSTA